MNMTYCYMCICLCMYVWYVNICYYLFIYDTLFIYSYICGLWHFMLLSSSVYTIQQTPIWLVSYMYCICVGVLICWIPHISSLSCKKLTNELPMISKLTHSPLPKGHTCTYARMSSCVCMCAKVCRSIFKVVFFLCWNYINIVTNFPFTAIT